MQIIGCDLHTRFQQIARPEAESGTIRKLPMEQACGEVLPEFTLGRGG